MSRKLILWLTVLALLTASAGCGAKQKTEPETRTVFAMDTVMNLSAYGKGAADALAEAEAELHRLDAELARGTEDSAVYRLNALGAVNDATVAYLLQESIAISEATGGAFDPTIAAVLELWGFGSGAGEHRVPSDDELAAALAESGTDKLHIEGAQAALESGEADLGGIAKGWAGQRVRDILTQRGVASAVIDLGGDVALLGKKPDGSRWRVAVRNPADTGAYLGILETGDVFVMTSGVYERYFEENGVTYHHIIDPATGYPADSGVVSATVICADGVWADALATAVCVMGAERAFALRDALADTTPFELILVTDDGRMLVSGGVADSFTPDPGSGYDYETIA